MCVFLFVKYIYYKSLNNRRVNKAESENCCFSKRFSWCLVVFMGKDISVFWCNV